MKRAVPQDTKDRQSRASHPNVSAWVSANAGSGKTHVLAQRVVRLLLEGTPPAKILCLTFTKAAAANMAVRVFDTLSGWTRLDDATLAVEVGKTGAPHPDSAMLVRARRLFARTVETPGGLKIQTIHAFCERLLHLFPFEANVAAGFEVLAEDEQQELIGAARTQAFIAAMHETSGPLADALNVLAVETSESGLDGLMIDALRHRAAIATMIRDRQGAAAWGQELGRRLGLRPAETLADLERAIINDGIPPSEWLAVANALERGGSNDGKLGASLRGAASADAAARPDKYLSVFFTKEEEPRGVGKTKIITKTLVKQEPGLLERLEAERDRLIPFIDKRKAARAVVRSVALFSIVAQILRVYADLKSQRGRLDFDDLIERTKTLLSRSDAAWVLYKLDAGIDHILVDEAQDTSPEQWSILQAIAEDFTAGAGARTGVRTFFAVGDEKQSIYSFQGAAPHMFDEMRRWFEARMREADQTFEQVRLNLSFRSVPTVLAAVDKVFEGPNVYRGVVAETDVWAPHDSWKRDLPGLVEMWDPAAGTAVDDPDKWDMPLDRQDASDPAVIIAKRIADAIAGWLAPQATEAVHDEATGLPRRISAGDILVLVRSRGPVFEAIIRALKDRLVPVAGADRLALTEHIGVQDLIAVGRASLLPEDDLTLACVLKSPLIGLDDDDLLAIAPRRPGSLAEALAASRTPAHQQASAQLAIWRSRAATLTPFRFYSELLGADGGRRRMLARLGPEAGDAIDEFQRLALQHERSEAPSLTMFLHRLEGADLSIKRDMEAAGDAVRVMTVHAAKGLESKIVFLPDTFGAASGRHDPNFFKLPEPPGEPLLVWGKGSTSDPAILSAARSAARLAEEAEQRRLLYVAMTRAEERLYVAGFHGLRPPRDCWYQTVRTALEPHCVASPAPWDASMQVWRIGDGLRLGAPAAVQGMPPPPMGLPDWLTTPAGFEASAAPPISPSSAMAAADQLDALPPTDTAFDGGFGLLSGRLMHALLQHLPSIEATRRAEVANRYLAARGDELPESDRKRLVDQALRLIDDPRLAALFSAGSRVEVSVAGRLERPGRSPLEIAGQIDRIAVSPGSVLIADFKTGRPRAAADIPQPYVTQLALYRAVLTPLYPDRPVRALLVWTSGPTVVELEPAYLDDALAQVLSA